MKFSSAFVLTSIARQTGKLVELSNQELIDCSWAAGNHGCRGGFQDRTLKWVKQNGVALKRDYGPYLAQVSLLYKYFKSIYEDPFLATSIFSFVIARPREEVSSCLKSKRALNQPVSIFGFLVAVVFTALSTDWILSSGVQNVSPLCVVNSQVVDPC